MAGVTGINWKAVSAWIVIGAKHGDREHRSPCLALRSALP
jgi:hypothetical protein